MGIAVHLVEVRQVLGCLQRAAAFGEGPGRGLDAALWHRFARPGFDPCQLVGDGSCDGDGQETAQLVVVELLRVTVVEVVA